MFQKKNLSVYVLLVAIIMFLGIVAGCSNDTDGASNNTSDDGGEETAPKIRVFKSHLSTGTLPESGDPHIEYVKEKTGVEYVLETVPAGADAAEHLNMLIASDDLPDILRPIGGVEQTLIDQGGALALDDLLPEYAP